MSLTASIGLMAIFAVDLVDMIFISMLGKAELAAAVGYAGAIRFFTSSFSALAWQLPQVPLCRGHGATRCRDGHSMLYGVIFSAIFAAILWFNIENLARLIGAKGDTLTLAVHYLKTIIPSLPFLVFSVVGGRFYAPTVPHEWR
jgi:Na+-driven multidrug efflux pump